MSHADHRREHVVSVLLRWGIVISGALLLLGFVLYAAQPSWQDLTGPAAMWDSLRSGNGKGPGNPFLWLYAGLLVLMLTPVARVALTVWMFFRERDWRYVGISLAVLCIIGGSIMLAFLL